MWGRVVTAPKFRNANGTLTRYAFACGYLEEYGDWLKDDGCHLLLEDGGNVYSVKGARDGEFSSYVWEQFESVVEARKFARTFGKLKVAL